MKTLHRFAALTLVGALLLSALAGCSSTTDTGSEDADSTNSSSASVDGTTVTFEGPDGTVQTVDTADMALAVSGIDADYTLFVVDGIEVPAEQYLFWLLSSINSYESTMGYAITEDLWTMEQDGITLGDYLMSEALSSAQLYAVLEAKAVEAGVTLSDEDLAIIAEEEVVLDEYLVSQGSSLQEFLDSLCISIDGYMHMYSMYYLNMGLMDALSVEGEVLEVTDEIMDTYIEDSGTYRVKHILLATQTTNDDYTTTAFTDEEKAAVLAEAEGYVADLRQSEDLEADFEALMNERSEDSRDANGDLYYAEYMAYLGQMVTEFETASLGLEFGEMSDPVETSYGYHIILRLDADTEDLRTEYAQTVMSTLLEEWMAEAEVSFSPEYDTLDPQAIYDMATAIENAKALATAPAVDDTTATTDSVEGE